MHYLSKRLLFFFSFLGLLSANSSPNWVIDGTNEGWKNEFLALKYFHNSELQRQWAFHLLGSHNFKGNETILDFGCGDGKITATISHFVPEGHVHGIDSSSSMITFAERCFPNSFYPNLTFERSSALSPNEKKYDVICSFCVFHLIADPVKLLQNFRENLNPDGILFLVIPCGNNPAFFQASEEILEKYKLPCPWKLKNSNSSAITMRTKEGCIDCLIQANLMPISISAFHNPTSFFNKQELVDWMVGTTSANWKIPLEISESFFNDVIDRMSELDPDVINESGAYHMKLSRLEVIAKPDLLGRIID
jgi:trans-aconitate 2-methyltransferase